MDEEKVDRLLREARNQIPIDQEFKKLLRKSLESQNRPKWTFRSKAFFSITAVAFLVLTFLMTDLQSKHVNADELMITNAVSFVDIAQGDINALEHRRSGLYMAIKKKGIFRATEDGLEKIVDTDADKVSVNIKETKLLFSNNGTIYIVDLNSHQQTHLLESVENINYTMPVWKSNDEIYFIKQTENENQVILMSIDTMDEQLIASGIGSTFDITEESIVYEADEKIIKIDLGTDEETLVDDGNSPSFSNDGRYITYIKEENGFEDVWIVDTDLQTKKKLTTNLEQRDSSQALYRYSSPVWDFEKNIVYLIKNRMNGSEIENIRLTKMELSTQQLTAQETVERFMQALNVRDDDYAKSLMDHPPEYLTVSNPSFKGYKVLLTNQTEDVEQVQVEVSLADSHLPYEVVLRLDFKLKQENGIFKIQEVSEVTKTELTSTDMENMHLIKENKILNLFSLNDIKTRNEIPNLDIRFSSVTFNSEEQVIYFGTQAMSSEQDNKFGVSLWSYDIKNHKLTFLDGITTIQSQQDIVLEGILLSPNRKYVAVDLFSEATSTPYLYIFNLENQEDFYLLKQSHSVFWKGERLYYELSNDGITTLHEFDTIKFD